MNELIKIEPRQISGSTIQTCNARDLWQFVESRAQFSDWIKGRIEKYAFVEGEDFTVQKFVNGRSTIIDYHLTIETAKELAMVENNEKGREVRRYFIECEKRAKAGVDYTSLSKIQILQLALESEQERLALEHKVEELAPKADALDRLSLADGEVCLQTAGKLLQQPPNKFIAWLRSLGTWIFKRPGSSRNSAYTDKINAGYLNVRTVTTIMPDGSERVTEQVVVTPKGLAKLAQMLGVTPIGGAA